MLSALALMISLVAHNPTPIPTPVKLDAIGKVREVMSGSGGRPQAVLQLEDKTELVLHGRDQIGSSELIHLAGVKVKIFGVKGDPLLPRGNHVRVDRYEILDIGDGVVPRMGHLAVLEISGKDRVLFVDDSGRAELLPEGYTTKMIKNAGARVWMVGTRDKSELVPTRFSILRPAPSAAEEK